MPVNKMQDENRFAPLAGIAKAQKKADKKAAKQVAQQEELAAKFKDAQENPDYSLPIINQLGVFAQELAILKAEKKHAQIMKAVKIGGSVFVVGVIVAGGAAAVYLIGPATIAATAVSGLSSAQAAALAGYNAAATGLTSLAANAAPYLASATTQASANFALAQAVLATVLAKIGSVVSLGHLNGASASFAGAVTSVVTVAGSAGLAYGGYKLANRVTSIDEDLSQECDSANRASMA